MSSPNVTRFVSTLTGGNYASWALNIESYLISQTLKHVLTDTAPVAGQTPTAEEVRAIADFKEHDERALGFILLCVNESIRYTVKSKGSANLAISRVSETHVGMCGFLVRVRVWVGFS